MKWMGGIVTGHAASPVHWNRYAVVAFVGGVCILVEVWSFDPCSYEYSGAPVQQKYVNVNRRRKPFKSGGEDGGAGGDAWTPWSRGGFFLRTARCQRLTTPDR